MEFRKNLPFKSYGVTHREPFSRSFGTNETQQLREGQLVGRMLLQRLATGATAVKQARYRRGPTRGSEALYAHAQYNTRSLAMHGVLNSAEGFEFITRSRE